MGKTVSRAETHRRTIVSLLCLLTILPPTSGCLGQASNGQFPAPVAQTASGEQPSSGDPARPDATQPISPLSELTPTYIPSTLATVVSPLESPLSTPETSGTLICHYFVVSAFEHDRTAFTQGLAISNGVFFESTGLNGRSSVRSVDLETGDTLEMFTLPDAYFGEGLAAANGQLIQLTWHSRTAFIYDERSISAGPIGQFAYPTEGWGLTYDGLHLIMSDGSATLYFRDATTFDVVREIQVQDGKMPVVRLNELEFVRGFSLANVWQTDPIAVIEPDDGSVVCWLDLAGILKDQDRLGSEDVLNGIAYDSATDRLYVTGKLWPRLFEIVVDLP
ncbi:MAG: glutaminyl-peptide cyclotransferase [Anaerolineae bacterium]|nr:glutaminyl-peptide cyclotransferase [Anaerolineae bacterium]